MEIDIWGATIAPFSSLGSLEELIYPQPILHSISNSGSQMLLRILQVGHGSKIATYLCISNSEGMLLPNMYFHISCHGSLQEQVGEILSVYGQYNSVGVT